MSDKRDIVWLRTADKQRYAGSLSLGGKTPPTGPKFKGVAKQRLGDILYNLGSAYQTSIAEFEKKYQKSLAEADKRFIERLPARIQELVAENGGKFFSLGKRLNDEEWAEHDKSLKILEADTSLALQEYCASIAPAVQKRKEDFDAAKKAHPKRWWQTESWYLGGVCGTCGTVIKKYCSKCNPTIEPI